MSDELTQLLLETHTKAEAASWDYRRIAEGAKRQEATYKKWRTAETEFSELARNVVARLSGAEVALLMRDLEFRRGYKGRARAAIAKATGDK